MLYSKCSTVEDESICVQLSWADPKDKRERDSGGGGGGGGQRKRERKGGGGREGGRESDRE